MKTLSLSKDKIRVLLLEGINPVAEDVFRDAGYENITRLSHSLPEQELIKEIESVHFLGISRSNRLPVGLLG